MNMQMQRKQLIMLILAMALAIVSYWIPLPPKSVTPPPSSGSSGAVERFVSVEPAVFAREPATAWRFPATTRMPQTMAHTSQAAPSTDGSGLAAKGLLEQRDLANDNRNHLNSASTTRIVPVTNPDHRPNP